MEVRKVTPEEYRVTLSGAHQVPLEQDGAWAPFSKSRGNPLKGYFLWEDGGKPVAGAAFYEHEMGGAKFLWAPRGPVWFRIPSPARESEALDDLKRFLKKEMPSAVFARLNVWYENPELRPPARVIGYDRTVIIDGAKGEEAAAMAALPSKGRRIVRRGKKRLAENNGSIQEETGLTRSEFQEFYSILEEAAARDGFTPHESEYYWDLLTELGPERMRLFSVRIDGKLACWDLVGVGGNHAYAYYGATSELARRTQTAPYLDFEVARLLGEEGVGGLDLMGIHSPRTPSLYDVGRYKQQFAENYTDVPMPFDLPLRRASYASLIAARNVKRAFRRPGPSRSDRAED